MAYTYDFVNRFSVKDELAFKCLIDAVGRLEKVYHDEGDFESDRRNRHNLKITLTTTSPLYYLATAKIVPDVIRAVRNGTKIFNHKNEEINYEMETLSGIYTVHDDKGKIYNADFTEFAKEKDFFETLSLLVADDDYICIHITNSMFPATDSRVVYIQDGCIKSYGVDYCIRKFANELNTQKPENKELKKQVHETITDIQKQLDALKNQLDML